MTSKCNTKDIALKGFFLGPQAENGPWVLEFIQRVFERWFKWRRSLYPADGKGISKSDQNTSDFLERNQNFKLQLERLLLRFENELPKFSPRYMGHMFSEISLPALFGHIVTLLHNPNNLSGESSRVGTQLENEAIGMLAQMVGYSGACKGHFTSGGTLANFEAIIRSRARIFSWLEQGALVKQNNLKEFDLFSASHMGWECFDRYPKTFDGLHLSESNPWELAKKIGSIFQTPFSGGVLLVPENKHYSWKKGVSILGLGDEAFWPISLNSEGKLCTQSLNQRIHQARKENRPIFMVVSVAGTTELGEIDPVSEVQEILNHWKTNHGVHIWHHVDAAYGGFFCTLKNQNKNLAALSQVDSITLDPHKLGYVPFSSGAFLVKERRNYYIKSYETPYLQFNENEDPGPFTIEGSRSAAGAVATWLTGKTIGFDENGYGRILGRTLDIKQNLEKLLQKSNLPIQIAPHTDTNILCFCVVAAQGELLSKTNDKTLHIYEALSAKARGPFIVSKTKLYFKSYRQYLESFIGSWHGKIDQDSLVLIRMCLMNPFFDSVEMDVQFSREFVECIRNLTKYEVG